MMKRLVLILLMVWPMTAWARPGLPSVEATRASLDREIPPLLATTKVPSVSIAWIRHGRVALTAAYGFQAAGAPATTDTLYNIASLTKPLTAEIVLRLASQGALSLDEPMARTWTDPDIAGDDRRMLLTPRLALSHRTGFPNWRNRKTGLAFLRDPGTKVGYSGEGYQYVARFAQKKTGRAFEDLAQTYLFDPIGMKHTSYIEKPWFQGRMAMPADKAGAPVSPFVPTKFNAADGVYTTPADYAAFMLVVMKDVDLSPAVAGERDRVQASVADTDCQGEHAATCPTQDGFGLGWEILVFPAATLMMHTGKDDGLFTLAYMNRTTGDGAVILTNGDNGDALVLPILRTLGTNDAYLRYLEAQMK